MIPMCDRRSLEIIKLVHGHRVKLSDGFKIQTYFYVTPEFTFLTLGRGTIPPKPQNLFF